MRKTISEIEIPRIKTIPVIGRDALGKGTTVQVPDEQWVNQSLNTVKQQVNTIIKTFNYSEQGVGPNIPSATAIIVTYVIHHVTGSTTITTITPTPEFGGGVVYLINDGSWSLATGGNIKTAKTPAANTVVGLVYDLNTRFWYILS